jgi:hypothetical protein
MKEESWEFWETANEAENMALLARIARLRESGIYVETLFDLVIMNSERQT